MHLDVRTKTVEEGIQLREEVGDSTFLLYAPGNGTIYLVLIQKLADCSPNLKDRMGLRDGEGWLVTHMGGTPMTSMVVIDNQGGLLHHEYVREKLKVSLADSVVLAELIGHVTGRGFIPSEEFLQDIGVPRSAIPCCERDHNRDGDCDRHPGSEAPNR